MKCISYFIIAYDIAGNTVVSFNDFNDFIHDYGYVTTFLQWEVALDLVALFCYIRG